MGFFDRLVKKTQNGVENRVAYNISKSIANGVDKAMHTAGGNILNAAQNPGGWTCKGCKTENRNSARFCANCGLERGLDKIFFKCDKCGYEHTDPNTSPKFCPSCGDPVNELDKPDN